MAYQHELPEVKPDGGSRYGDIAYLDQGQLNKIQLELLEANL